MMKSTTVLSGKIDFSKEINPHFYCRKKVNNWRTNAGDLLIRQNFNKKF